PCRWPRLNLSAGRRAGAEPLAVAIEVPCVLIVGAVQEVGRGLATLGVQLLPLGVGEVELGRTHRVGVDEDRAGYGMAGLDVHPVVEAGHRVHYRLAEGQRSRDPVLDPEIRLRTSRQLDPEGRPPRDLVGWAVEDRDREVRQQPAI